MSLVNHEHSFLSSLIQPNKNTDDFISKLVGVGSLSIEKQLSIYQSNINGAHQKVLAQVYPACMNILGEDYFNQLCFEYRCQYPSMHPDLNLYGKQFTSFLEQQVQLHNELQEFEYLPELAQIEWSWHRCYFSKDDRVFDFEALASVNPEEHGKLYFNLSFSISLHSTCYPLIEIWNANIRHKESEASLTEQQEFTLPDSETYFCLWRDEYSPTMEYLTRQQYGLLDLILNKTSLLELSDLGLNDELVSLIQKRWVTGFFVADSVRLVDIEKMLSGIFNV